MVQPKQPVVFGKRKEPHTIIIAQGDQIRHFTVRPWLAALAGSVVAAFAIGYLLATTYLVLRDDLIGAAIARQARMQHDYEDRISLLRSQVDRITSRQLLDQQLMEDKVDELIKRQTALNQRHGRLGPLLDRAAGKTGKAPVPKPTMRSDERAALDVPAQEAKAGSLVSGTLLSLIRGVPEQRPQTAADRNDRLFANINQSLRTIEDEQISSIETLTESAYDKAGAIAEALETAGLKLDVDYGKSGTGGPLISPDNVGEFDLKVRELDQALAKLDAVKAKLKRFPIANPAPGRAVTSRFGMRKDPLLGTPALHSGMDFRAGTGYAIRATASGRVSKAGWNGGYGRMVEIDHGNGLATRYAHMSKILVKPGQRVAVGDVVGRVGSSGRSTGPHLHYEVRRAGKAVNPIRFLRAGKKIRSQL